MKIAIIGAMASEVEHLKGELANAEVTTVAGMDFCAGKLGEKDVVVVQCGIGKVNAGVCVQVLCDRFGATHVINTGVAGSLDDTLNIGDLVVSTDCVQHDFTVEQLGYAAGEVPGVGASFAAAPELRDAALAAAAEVAPQIRAVGGRVASGDQFISAQGAKDRITSTFAASCCEMEGAAIAQVATLNGVPFVVVRAISDKPGAEGQVMDYATFEAQAAENCARIVEQMVLSL